VLRWNDKHNGDKFLDRIAELLKENVPSAKVIKLYEIDKSTIKISGSVQEAARIAKVIKANNADIVIGSQTD
jgi:primosomal protein N'